MPKKMNTSEISQSNSHNGLMIFCGLLVAGTFWSFADSVRETNGAGLVALVFTVVASIGLLFLLRQSPEDGEEDTDEERS